MISKKTPAKSYDSKRYTAPAKVSEGEGNGKVTILASIFTVLGLAIITLNQLDGALLPGKASRSYVLLGVGLIVLGLMVLTHWRGERAAIIVPAIMFGLFFAGVAVIVLNYFNGAPLLPGPSSQTNLLMGLGLLTAGFVASTQWR